MDIRYSGIVLYKGEVYDLWECREKFTVIPVIIKPSEHRKPDMEDVKNTIIRRATQDWKEEYKAIYVEEDITYQDAVEFYRKQLPLFS